MSQTPTIPPDRLRGLLWRIYLTHATLALPVLAARGAAESWRYDPPSTPSVACWIVLGFLAVWAWADAGWRVRTALRPPHLPRLPFGAIFAWLGWLLTEGMKADKEKDHGKAVALGCLAPLALSAAAACVAVPLRFAALLWENPLTWTLVIVSADLALMTAALAKSGVFAAPAEPRTMADRIRAAREEHAKAVGEVKNLEPPEEDDSDAAEGLRNICGTLITGLNVRLEDTLRRILEGDDDDPAEAEDGDEGRDEGEGPFPAPPR
jgi:hypothetical protein